MPQLLSHRALAILLALLVSALISGPVSAQPTETFVVEEFAVPRGSNPHDAVPDGLGWVWYAAQGNGEAGALNAATGEIIRVPLGRGSAPHGVVMGPDGAPWFTDGGLNAIVRVDPWTLAVNVYPLSTRNANLNTATFDHDGILWFTGQNGVLGRLDPGVGVVETWNAPKGPGPYGISTAPDGTVYYASLAGSYLGRINGLGVATVLEPPTPGQGTRRVWSDSLGRQWIAEYNARKIGRYDPASGDWAEWTVPGANARPYAIYVDELDKIWISDTGADTVVRFDPETEAFTTIPISRPSNVAQLGGLPGEVWGAQRARDHIFVVRHKPQ
ncbi:MAG: lyase [Chloroflexi bacterium]|nr:lyase [Chloroflexota bacterium]